MDPRPGLGLCNLLLHLRRLREIIWLTGMLNVQMIQDVGRDGMKHRTMTVGEAVHHGERRRMPMIVGRHSLQGVAGVGEIGIMTTMTTKSLLDHVEVGVEIKT